MLLAGCDLVIPGGVHVAGNHVPLTQVAVLVLALGVSKVPLFLMEQHRVDGEWPCLGVNEVLKFLIQEFYQNLDIPIFVAISCDLELRTFQGNFFF